MHTVMRPISPLRFARLLRGRQQVDVSFAARIVQGRLSRIETGVSTPTADERARILAALGMTADELADLEAALQAIACTAGIPSRAPTPPEPVRHRAARAATR
jgi:transcriptional regulator with XRE-family HTH domain